LIKHLHVIHNDKFTDDFIKFILNNFKPDEHRFIVIGKLNRSEHEISTLENDLVYRIEALRNLKTLLFYHKFIYKAERLHFHGLFNGDLIKLLYLQPWLLKKSNWIIWGGDLYFFQKPKDNWKKKINEFCRKAVIKNFNEITSFIPGDYKVAKKVYKTEADYNYAITYNVFAEPSYYDKLVSQASKNNSKTTFIQVGNSADSSNNHIDILKMLLPYKEKDIKIVVPLSYGDERHKERIITFGNVNFGDKFKPITDFYELKEYLKVLNQVEVAIFNHKRQQGLGNMTKLLRLGKKVYLRSDISSWDYFNNIGAKVYDTLNINDISFEELTYYSTNIKEENINIIKKIMSDEYRIELWNEILEKKI